MDSEGRPQSEFGRIRTAVPNLSSAGFGRTGGFGRIRTDGREGVKYSLSGEHTRRRRIDRFAPGGPRASANTGVCEIKASWTLGFFQVLE